MSELRVLISGLSAAAELAALLFVSPAAALEPTRAESSLRLIPGVEKARGLNLLSSSLDVRLLNSVVDVRVNQLFRNDGDEPVSLAKNVPVRDDSTDVLRIHRRERIIDLLRLDTGCGNEEESDDDENSPTAGHAQLEFDELLADALQLAPGDSASIEVVTAQPLAGAGRSYRLELPSHAAVAPQALLIDQASAYLLVVIPQHAERATARLTLRPFFSSSDAASRDARNETIELGRLGASPIAYVVPLADRAALQALAAGAIELETRSQDGVVWSTLAAQVRTDTGRIASNIKSR